MQNTKQREIKFRAWDKVNHDWYKRNPKLSRMTYYANPTVYDDGWLQFESVGQDAIGDSPSDRFELMQFTGLKDKNGNEIYESDIIKIFYKDEEDRVAINSIEYNEKTACFEFSKSVREFRTIGGHNLQIFADNGNFYFEVIGNVWENPELLK